jgi:prevent-host-death family protein
MTKTVPAINASEKLGEMLGSVRYRNDEVIIERSGEPMGVLIPMAQYQKLERHRTEELAKIAQIWADVPQMAETADAEQEILTEVQAVRHGH